MLRGLLVLLALTPAVTGSADGRLELTTERVVVFKDGYAMVVKRGVGTTDGDGVLVTHEVPDGAVLGSFWATPVEGRLLAMTAGVVSDSEKLSEHGLCTDRRQLLEANQGRRCVVTTHDGARLEGTILKVLSEQGAPRIEAESEPTIAALGIVTAARAGTATLFVLRTADGDVVLGIDQVRRLTLNAAELECDRLFERTTTRKQLSFRFAGAGQRRELVLVYFTPGLRWIPTYRLDLEPGSSTGGEARISLQAEILNELEDLDGVSFDLVVGVPSFRFREVPSPLALESTLRNALEQAAPHLMGQQLSNAMFTQRASEWRAPVPRRGQGHEAAIVIPEELSTEQVHDLFVYSIPALSLDRGHRAAVPLFEARVPYRDVYTWSVAIGQRGQPLPPGLAGMSPLELSESRVWHQVELDNTSDVPWTTGAALLMDGHKPLAQELLTYTPAGSRVLLPVTVAVGLHGSIGEQETGRTADALHWAGRDFARIDSRAIIDLHNGRQVPIAVEITCDLGGRATTASNVGTIVLGPHRPADWEGGQGYGAVNPHSTVSWVVEVQPGEAVSRTVDLHRFVRY